MNHQFSTPIRQRPFPTSSPEWLNGSYDRSLPILSKRREIVETIRAHQVVIVAGETGCGKTTQLPLMCLEARGEKAGRIAVAQPRRIAALSLAKHVASLLPGGHKDLVGYKIRFYEHLHPETKILFATDGIILAETAGDQMLYRYETIIIDEAHERNIPIDFLLGYLRTVLIRRPELKLVIASATMDTRLFSRCFRNAPVITVSGRRYPVEIRYEPVISLWQGSALRSYIDGVLHAVQSIIDSGETGDILAFLPTVDDLHECCTGIRAFTKGKACDVFHLYGRMSPDEQAGIFTRSSRRRIICATNIAETSITVPDIRFIVDTGLARCVRFDPVAGITRMPVERISKASADQRAGRCGRVRDGICIRLYSEADYASMPRYTLPEIRRSNLAGVILRMARLGFGKPQQFPFMQQPSSAGLDAGYRQLRFLGAFDSRGRLTGLGKAMAALPLDPAIARMLFYAQENGAFNELAVIASALSVGEIRADQGNPEQWGKYGKKNRFAHDRLLKGYASDFTELIDVWRNLPWNNKEGISRRRLGLFCRHNGFSFQRVKEWVNVHRQLVAICRRFGRVQYGFKASYEEVHKSLLSALAGNVAEASENGLYCTGRMGEIMISPGSKLFGTRHDWVLFHDITETKRPYARYAAIIKTRWIQDLFLKQCRTTYEEPRFDPERGTVACLRQVYFNGLQIVKNQRIDFSAVQPEAAHEIFIWEALVHRHVGNEYDFLLKNRLLQETVECVQRKLRTHSLYRGDQALAEFYRLRLPEVSSVAQLNVRIGRAKGDRFLHVRTEDLLSGPLPGQLSDYPDKLIVAGQEAPVSYAFKPEADVDGATTVISLSLYNSVPIYYWEWLLPAFWRPRIRHIVQQWTEGIPSAELDQGVEEVAQSFTPGQGHFLNQTLPLVQKVFGLTDANAGYSLKPIPPHLWLRLLVVDKNGNCIDTFRPPFHLPSLPIVRHAQRPTAWREWCAPWECEDVSGWNRHQVFQKVSIASPGQLVPVFGITGFARENDHVAMRVFFSRGAAYCAHRQGIRLLLERALDDAIAWAWRDFLKLHRLPFQLRERMEAMKVNGCLELLFHEIILDPGYDLPEDAGAFIRSKEHALERIAQAGSQSVALMSAVLPEYEACLRFLKERAEARSPSFGQTEHLRNLESQLEEYREILFQPSGRLDKMNQLPRYLRGFLHRMRMAMDKPVRYAACVQTLREFASTARRVRGQDAANLPPIARLLDEFEGMIEEYMISLFAHGQLSTRFPVSEQRLRKSMEELCKALSEAEGL